MVERAERVADVVEQGAGHVVIATVGPIGPCRRLQRVGQTINQEAAEVSIEKAQVSDDTVGEVRIELHRRSSDVAPVLLGPLCHRPKGRSVGCGRRIGGHGSAHASRLLVVESGLGAVVQCEA